MINSVAFSVMLIGDGYRYWGIFMTKARKTFNLFTISEARNVLFGIATLWIGLFHSDNLTMAHYTDNQFLIDAFRFFKGTGNVGVDMFLFLSGVGLFFSFTKDGRVLSFWKKRLLRILPTAFLIATFYVCFRYVNGRFTSGFDYFFSRMTFTYFFIKGERVFWFISLILALYIIFPVLYRIIERFKGLGTIGLVVLIIAFNFALRAFTPGVYTNIEIAMCRIPVFIIGIWAGKFVMEKREISKKWLWAFLAAAVGMLVFMYFYTDIVRSMVPDYNKDMETMYIFLYRYAACPLGISLVVLDSYLITQIRRRGQLNVLRNFFEFVGMYSMEYYMIYLNVNHYLERIYEISSEHLIMLYFGSFVISLVLCMLVRKVCDLFMAYMQKKPKEPVDLTEDGLSTKWYGFLTCVGLYILAVYNVFIGIAYLTEGMILPGIFALVITVFAVVTRIYLAKREAVGAILLYILLALNPLLILLDGVLRNDLLHTILGGGKKAIFSTLVFVGFTALVIRWNKKYFDKRKKMFIKK